LEATSVLGLSTIMAPFIVSSVNESLDSIDGPTNNVNHSSAQKINEAITDLFTNNEMLNTSNCTSQVGAYVLMFSSPSEIYYDYGDCVVAYWGNHKGSYHSSDQLQQDINLALEQN
jgi:hypothetical protein